MAPKGVETQDIASLRPKQSSNHLDNETVLFKLDPLVQAVRRIIGTHGHFGTGKNGAVIHPGGDAVDGAAGDGQPLFDGLGDDVGTTQRWDDQACTRRVGGTAIVGKQGGVLVDHAPREAGEECGRKHPHKASQHHQVGREGRRDRSEALLPRGAGGLAGGTTGCWGQWHIGSGNPVGQGALQPVSLGAITDDERHAGTEASSSFSVKERLEVRARTAEQHRDGVHDSFPMSLR